MQEFDRFIEIVKKLRDPGGCPWDREQTPESLRTSLVEETYECIDAIDEKDDGHMREELGDLLLLVSMIGYMREQESAFTIQSVIEGISEKLVRRHPHVFGTSDVSTSSEVLTQWDHIKNTIEGRSRRESALDEIPASLPPLQMAHKLQKRAAKVGFDWQDAAPVWGKIDEELGELRSAIAESDAHMVEHELGDLFFSLVNLSRHLGVDPAVAINGANRRFNNRFRYVERGMASEGRTMSSEQMSHMDRLWEESKQRTE